MFRPARLDAAVGSDGGDQHPRQELLAESPQELPAADAVAGAGRRRPGPGGGSH